jgi:hypothetical protein
VRVPRTDDLTSGLHVSHQLAFERLDPRPGTIDLHWKVVNPQVSPTCCRSRSVGRSARARARPGSRAVPRSGVVLRAFIASLITRAASPIWLQDLKP